MARALELSHLALGELPAEAVEERRQRLEAACQTVEDFADPLRIEALQRLLQAPSPAEAELVAACVLARSTGKTAALLLQESQRFLELSAELSRASQADETAQGDETT